MSNFFIAVEGPIGVGKSSLSSMLSRTLHASILKEIVSENPFLPLFYENIEEYSFQTEMFFLCNRVKQLEDLHKFKLQKGISVVSDYHIMKNLVFAKLTLDQSKYEKYEKVYHILSEDLPKPHMLIYLNATTDTLLRRIAMRGRDFEAQIDASYLQRLSNEYISAIEIFKKHHPDTIVITLDVDDIDFVHNKQDYNFILQTIKKSMPLEWNHEICS
ncbi:deoxynucleoside kinase [Bacillus sp. HMF5848]|uniref:deoxynucleoside kinase n=1 Tax=Bacillus sp. HMF5848 TaxID=2495421 RepID=UPI000F7A8EAA|nr:deoxynucleoside kinase [Bacillus sp. HMF5848]RSK25452.1 deoxynucleoside kinase [Bacillus sp. HMF5848]